MYPLRLFGCCLCLLFTTQSCFGQLANTYPLLIEDIRIRDPFVYVDTKAKKYYMYAQLGNRLNNMRERSKLRGVEVYVSRDLNNWSLPQTVLLLQEDAWARKMVWAPEVFKYKEKYYLFTTLTGRDFPEGMRRDPSEGFEVYEGIRPLAHRGTQVFYADSPLGPFTRFENKPHTPIDWMCLDGTLWEEDGRPYMVFCHEHRQVVDGTIAYIRLENDLSASVGDPITLFRASEAPWQAKRKNHVTDGCFMYRTRTGKLLMIWSSFAQKGYCVAVAESISGRLAGPWKHHHDLLFDEHGGHGMLFKDLNGQLRLVLHQPNEEMRERAKFYAIEDIGEGLRIVND